MKGKFRSKMSCLLHVSLYINISRQFLLLVILHFDCVMDVFHFLYAKVIYLYFCNKCISLYWTSKINSSISEWRYSN